MVDFTWISVWAKAMEIKLKRYIPYMNRYRQIKEHYDFTWVNVWAKDFMKVKSKSYIPYIIGIMTKKNTFTTFTKSGSSARLLVFDMILLIDYSVSSFSNNDNNDIYIIEQDLLGKTSDWGI